MLSSKKIINILRVFSEEECDDLIKEANKQQWKLVDNGIAYYHRVILIDKSLSDKVFERVKHVIPEYINEQKIIGLNDHFRFSKYYEGGSFGKHTDGINIDKNGNRSMMTLNIFIDGPEEGGGTIFYSNDIVERVVPHKGIGVLFSHNILHEGEVVKKGIKYLIRTDVMTQEFTSPSEPRY